LNKQLKEKMVSLVWIKKWFKCVLSFEQTWQGTFYAEKPWPFGKAVEALELKLQAPQPCNHARSVCAWCTLRDAGFCQLVFLAPLLLAITLTVLCHSVSESETRISRIPNSVRRGLQRKVRK